MKPVSVRFKCFGPYMEEQLIDFTQLEQNGLFLICGETGSGKTTILDAMCYALYGKSSGRNRGELENMRCKLAGPKDETLVEFVFDCGGQRYRFTRSLRMGRKNLNDDHGCAVWKDGVFVPLLENPKKSNVNAMAESIIGLTCEQFCQVIILPQGQFEKLLVSDSTEKEAILVSLFHAEQWQRMADEIARRVSERDKALQEERHAMQVKLSEYGVADLAALAEACAAQAEALEGLTLQVQAAEAAATAGKQALDSALLEEKEFAELTRREQKLTGLERQGAGFDREAELLAAADLAEGVRPVYDAMTAARKSHEDALRQQTAARAALEKARGAEETAQIRRENHERMRPVCEQQKRQAAVLENARELYRSLDRMADAAGRTAKQRQTAQTVCDRAEKLFRQQHQAWLDAMGAQELAQQDYFRGQQLYLDGIGAVLAQRLEEGKPCLVCGSIHHPDPAKAVGDHVTEEELESLNQRMQAAGQAVSRAYARRSEAEQQHNAARTELLEQQQAEAAARAEYELALQQRMEGVDSLETLEATLKTLRRDLEGFERAETETAAVLTKARSVTAEAQGRVQSAEDAVSAAEAAYNECVDRWAQALAETGIADEAAYLRSVLPPKEKQQRQQALMQYRTDLAHAREEARVQRDLLEGRSCPDVQGLRKACAEAESALKGLLRSHSIAESLLERMTAAEADLRQRQASYGVRRQKVDEDLDFANRLRGRHGVSLQRYVLGVMLTSITAAANRLLKNVHGGRYQLYRRDDVAGKGHKSGLELGVYDARHNQQRSVTTLSGGEKFLVALSLAIGLSTVVQAQGGGIRLEAMFIDEGFGSLDSSSIHDALEVLQGVRRGSGLVGIISHVDQLAETIPAQIHIIKGEHGSRCEVRL